MSQCDHQNTWHTPWGDTTDAHKHQVDGQGYGCQIQMMPVTFMQYDIYIPCHNSFNFYNE